MYRLCILLLTLLAPLLFVHCSQRDAAKASRNNIYDAAATNWQRNQTPTVTVTTRDNNNIPSWYSFNFEDSTGTVLLQFESYDPNERFDTLHYVLRIGFSPQNMDPVYRGSDSLYALPNLLRNTRYFYHLTVYDRFDSAGIDSGSFLSPLLLPVHAPENLSAVDGTATIALSWSSVAGAAGYRIYRSLTIDGQKELIDSTMLTSYTDRTSSYHTFYYAVAAYDYRGENRSAQTVSGRRTVAITAPDNLTAFSEPAAGSIMLTWNMVSGAASYHIFRSQSGSGTFVDIATISGVIYHDTVEYGGQYFYRIASFDNQNRGGPLSNWQSASTTLLATPVLNASKGLFSAFIALSWDTIPDALGYIIYRSKTAPDDPHFYSAIDTIATTTYHDATSGVLPCYYKIAASNSSGKGSLSNYAIGWLLQPPHNLRILTTLTDTTKVSFAWDYRAGTMIRGFNVYRSTDSTTFIRIGTVNDTAHLYHDTVADYRLYFYRVQMITDSSISGFSNTVSGSRKPAQPTRVQAAPSQNAVVLSWNSCAGASGYQILRSEVLYDSTAATFFIDSLHNDSLYEYRVVAYNAGGPTSPSAMVIGHRISSAPATPAMVTVTPGAAGITIAWRESPTTHNTQGFYLLRSTATTLPVVVDTMLTDSLYYSQPYGGTTVFSLVDTVHDSAQYSYQLIAFNKNGTSSASGAVSARRAVPGAIQTVVATQGTYGDRIIISWHKNQEADYYWIIRSTDSLGLSGLADSTVAATDTSITDRTTTTTNVYYYTVYAVNEIGPSLPSPKAQGNRLGSPSHQTASAGIGAVVLRWHRVIQSRGYYLYRSTVSAAGPFTRLDSLKTNSDTSYVDTVDTAAPCYYKITAYNQNESDTSGQSAISATCLPPQAPRALEAAASSDTTDLIHLSWNATGGAKRYTVYRVTDPAAVPVSPLVTTTGIAYADTVTNDSTYYYFVKAANNAGQSPLSIVSSGAFRKRPLLTPNAPTNCRTTTSAGVGSVTVEWNPADSTTDIFQSGFAIYRTALNADSSATFTALDTLPADAVAYPDRAAAIAPDWYWYRVTALNYLGQSLPSNAAQGMR